MLATHSLSLCSSPVPTTRPSLPPVSRPALADSTNISTCAHVCGPRYQKALVYPISSTRTVCGWSDVEASSSTLPHSRHHHWPSTPSLFPVTQKAPPTVSISLSAACSQNTIGELLSGSRVCNLEPDLPDVRSVVPFPSVPLDGDTDVEMLDGTCGPYPEARSVSATRAPRKRRSAHSSVSSSQGSLGKEAKPKRPRKSKQQVAELAWLGIIHRSILRDIEARQPDATASLLTEMDDLDVMDRLLVEKIQKRLTDNGCSEGRVLANPLSRISSPSMSVPSLNLSTPGGSSIPSSPQASDPCPPATQALLDSSSPLSIPTSPRPHVRFEIPSRSRKSHLSVPRRSPSPPARAATAAASTQTLTLTMPQLVASLTLAYRDRSRPRLRGRPYKVTECGKNARRSLSSVSYQAVQRGDGDEARVKEGVGRSCMPRARTSSATARKSPLSHVAYAES